MNQLQDKSPQQHAVFFTILFTACIVGSIAIFLFAVGLETGNRIVNFTMRTLLENSLIVVGLVIVFNAAVFLVYLKNKKKG